MAAIVLSWHDVAVTLVLCRVTVAVGSKGKADLQIFERSKCLNRMSELNLKTACICLRPEKVKPFNLQLKSSQFVFLEPTRGKTLEKLS